MMGPAMIEQVNQQVNAEVRYVRADGWSTNFAQGDCKTYAADKLALLLAAGVDPHRLSLWVVRDEANESHAVLVLDGHTVLDNRFAWTEERPQLEHYGYRFLFEMPASVGTPR